MDICIHTVVYTHVRAHRPTAVIVSFTLSFPLYMLRFWPRRARAYRAPLFMQLLRQDDDPIEQVL